MGGRIEVDSKLGEGSIFRFFIKVGKVAPLPATAACGVENDVPVSIGTQAVEEPRKTHPDRKIRVFVVEGA